MRETKLTKSQSDESLLPGATGIPHNSNTEEHLNYNKNVRKMGNSLKKPSKIPSKESIRKIIQKANSSSRT